MWAFLTARLRAWVFMAIAVPLFFGALSLIRRKIEARSGPNTFTRGMGKVEEVAEDVLHRK